MRSRTALLALLLFAAGAASAAVPMGTDDARHLLGRTSFSATPREIAEYAVLTRAQAVERLLAGVRAEPSTPPPEWVEEWTPLAQVRALPEEERRALLRRNIQRAQVLKAWWMGEMLATPSPFTEKMTLFWHNHFVTSIQKVRSPMLNYRHNLLLRRHAFGSFGDMLHAVAREPAMIAYLDGATSRKGQPNENFAREVMELFTLGEGRYGEQDVKEAARAFTGYSIDGETGRFLFRPMAHDDGVKTVLGVTGALDGDAVLDILLARPETAEFVVAKLWREFVSPVPDAAEVRRIAGLFRASRYDVRAALRALLTSEAFYATENRGSLIKSPVELIVGTLRQFGFETTEAFPFALTSRQLGQDLFAPPNVKGWPGGEAWINASTLLGRKQFLERIFRSEERSESGPMMAAARIAQTAPGPERIAVITRERFERAMADVRFDAERWRRQLDRQDPVSVARFVLAARPANPPVDVDGTLALLRQITQDPVYQLK